jgi:hypothetical protein
MTRGRRGRVIKRTTLTVGFFSVIVLALFTPSWVFPSPHQADSAAVRRWLALRDLRAQPHDVQLAMVDRIQLHLAPRDLLSEDKGTSQGISRYFHARVKQNVRQLKRVWFESRCLQYCASPPEERLSFLQRQITTLQHWTRALQTRHDSETSEGTNHGWGDWFDDLAEWTREAAGARRSCFRQGIRDGVLYWLATENVTDLPPLARGELATRLAEQLGQSSGQSLEPPLLPFSADQQSRLEQNAWHLAEAWFHTLARDFAKLPREQRDAFVDARIDEVLAWNVPSYLRSDSDHSATISPPDGSPPDGVRPFDSSTLRHPATINVPLEQAGSLWLEAARWGDRAEPEMQPAIEQLLQRVQWRLMARMLPRLWPRSAAQTDSPPLP